MAPEQPQTPPSAALRRALAVAAALVLAGSLAALAPAPMPPAIGDAWLLVRIAAQLLAVGVVVSRARARRADRTGWALLAAAVAVWTTADALTAVAGRGDAGPLWLTAYVLLYGGVVMLTRPLLVGRRVDIWLDGVIAALSLAALVAFAVDCVVGAVPHPVDVLAFALAYPVADLALVGMAVGACAVTGWRPPASWRWLGIGMLAMLAGDLWYFAALTGSAYAYGEGAAPEGLWPLAFLAFALAATQRDTRSGDARARSWGMSAVPATAVAVSGGLLVADHWLRANDGVTVIAALAVAAVAVRNVVTMRALRQLGLSRLQALTDELTGLANRRALLRAAAAACSADAPRDALLLCDLDGFKEFNDTLGHEAGDHLLREAAARIRRAVDGAGEAARLGGDEFAVLMRGASREAAVAVARRLREELSAPLPVAGIAVRLDASVGIALAPEHAGSAAGLLRRADVAMYQAKATRAGVEVYDAARDLHSRERLVLAAELRDAVEHGRLDVHFQPKVDVADGRVVGAEALVRWPHPERGLLYPDVFLPAAEQAGLMRPLTLVVLDRALAACGRWTAAGRDLGVAVNLSASNLLDASLADEVSAMLSRHGVAAHQLTLEVTEGTILANPLRGGEVLAAVRRLGVAVSLDDFGTGHSSLSHVKRLPVDELKIDRSFVTDIATDATDRAIVASTVRLAHALGMTATAEGVESEEALAILRGEGCDLAQGYLFSRPLPEAELTVWLVGRALTDPRPARVRTAGCRPAGGS